MGNSLAADSSVVVITIDDVEAVVVPLAVLVEVTGRVVAPVVGVFVEVTTAEAVLVYQQQYNNCNNNCNCNNYFYLQYFKG